MRTAYNLDYLMPKEGAMMRQQLTGIVNHATALRNALHPDDNVPAWTQFMVSTAEDRLHIAGDYLTEKIRLIQEGGAVHADLDGLDEFLNDALDLGGREERAARQIGRRGRRYDRKKRDKAKLRILLRVAVKAAKKNGKKLKKGFMGSSFRRALRAGDKLLDSGKSMHSALVAALVSMELSKKDAEKNATFTIASVEKGSYKAGHAALKKKYGKKKSTKTSKTLTATATATEQNSYDPNEFVSEDAEFNEDTELPEDDADIELDEYEDNSESLEGFGVASAQGTMLDRAKPYMPWIALAVGVGIVVYNSSKKHPNDKK